MNAYDNISLGQVNWNKQKILTLIFCFVFQNFFFDMKKKRKQPKKLFRREEKNGQ